MTIKKQTQNLIVKLLLRICPKQYLFIYEMVLNSLDYRVLISDFELFFKIYFELKKYQINTFYIFFDDFDLIILKKN